jgi:hypothetical protein
VNKFKYNFKHKRRPNVTPDEKKNYNDKSVRLMYNAIKFEDSLGYVSQQQKIGKSSIFITIMYHQELTPKSYELYLLMMGMIS